MHTAEKDPVPRAPVALTVLTAIVYAAGFAMVAAWFALLLLDQHRPSAPPRAVSSCGICGVVQGVAEFERAGLQLSGDQSEGFVVLLAVLSGLNNRVAPPKVYETAVLHDDGSVRIVRDSSAPQWKRGDRVRVIKGRVEPGEFAAAARAVSPAERTPTPVLPVARAP
jgi:hypothetical protein